MEHNGSRKKVVGYTRVSTKDQAEMGVSLAAQRCKIIAYADLYNLELVAIKEDAGMSAKTLDRPSLQEALEMLRTGEVQGILVAKIDRLSRSITDMGKLVNTYFRSGEQALISVADQFDTTTANGRLFLNMMTMMSEWEREVIAERTKTALAHLKAQGVQLGAPPVDPGVADLVRNLRDKGLSYRAVANELRTRKIPTKKGLLNWGPETIRRICQRTA